MTSPLTQALADAHMRDMRRAAAAPKAPRQRRVLLRLPGAPRLRRSRRALPA
ncbi:MAG TPA: hypothetical protein VGF25_11930 [Thermoleophilaceae bacterium]